MGLQAARAAGLDFVVFLERFGKLLRGAVLLCMGRARERKEESHGGYQQSPTKHQATPFDGTPYAPAQVSHTRPQSG